MIRRYTSENTTILLYKTTILLIIDYNDIIYSFLTQQQETRGSKIEHFIKMHRLAKIDILTERRNLHLMMLMHK